MRKDKEFSIVEREKEFSLAEHAVACGVELDRTLEAAILSKELSDVAREVGPDIGTLARAISLLSSLEGLEKTTEDEAFDLSTAPFADVVAVLRLCRDIVRQSDKILSRILDPLD